MLKIIALEVLKEIAWNNYKFQSNADRIEVIKRLEVMAGERLWKVREKLKI